MQCRRSDKKVLEGKLDPLGLLLALDTSREPGNFERDWMDRHVLGQSVDKLKTVLPLFRCFGPVGSVYQLRNCHDRNGNFSVAMKQAHLLQDLSDRMASAFGRDEGA